MFGMSNECPLLYEVQAHPQRPGWAIVTMRDAIRQNSDGLWEYDEYVRAVPDTDDLPQRVANNAQEWLEGIRANDPNYQARMETAAQMAVLTNQACELAEQVLDLQLELANAGVTI